ncbi:MAG: hypothetical protein IPG32_08085 [Saprospirales bacterium]|nr:hypothetical protein [Saprospirales bacterium]
MILIFWINLLRSFSQEVESGFWGKIRRFHNARRQWNTCGKTALLSTEAVEDRA